MKTNRMIAVGVIMGLDLFLVIVIAAGLFGYGAGLHDGCVGISCSDVTERVARESYVAVQTNRGFGSGTEGVWKGRVYVLTARHVIEGVSEILVTGDRKAVVIGEEEASDLALLWVQSPRPQPLLPPLQPVDRVEVGEDCWYTTNGGGVDGYTVRGQIAKCDHPAHGSMNMKARTFLCLGQGTYGSSGGGIYVKRDGQMKLAGVVSHISALEPAMRCPLASPKSSDIRKFLEKVVP